MIPLAHLVVDSPIGPLTLVADDHVLREIHFATHAAPANSAPAAQHPVLQAAHIQLAEYFAGQRRYFQLPVAAFGTEFQQRVWEAVGSIPYGCTASYLEIARQVGDRNAVRAVGLANGRNPLPLVVPCHRVVGSDGDLTGYRGGVDAKRWLLRHEGALPAVTQAELFG